MNIVSELELELELEVLRPEVRLPYGKHKSCHQSSRHGY